jgi:hypothetical protein
LFLPTIKQAELEQKVGINCKNKANNRIQPTVKSVIFLQKAAKKSPLFAAADAGVSLKSWVLFNSFNTAIYLFVF